MPVTLRSSLMRGWACLLVALLSLNLSAPAAENRVLQLDGTNSYVELLSKIEAGKMTLYLEDFQVAPLVQDVAKLVQPLVAKKGNRLEVDCPADLGSMRSDQTKVRQVLFNLLSNAAKFTERGTIRLEVRGPKAVGRSDAGGELSTFNFQPSTFNFSDYACRILI